MESVCFGVDQLSAPKLREATFSDHPSEEETVIKVLYSNSKNTSIERLVLHFRNQVKLQSRLDSALFSHSVFTSTRAIEFNIHGEFDLTDCLSVLGALALPNHEGIEELSTASYLPDLRHITVRFPSTTPTPEVLRRFTEVLVTIAESRFHSNAPTLVNVEAVSVDQDEKEVRLFQFRRDESESRSN